MFRIVNQFSGRVLKRSGRRECANVRIGTSKDVSLLVRHTDKGVIRGKGMDQRVKEYGTEEEARMHCTNGQS
jgi:hypothetical protein